MSDHNVSHDSVLIATELELLKNICRTGLNAVSSEQLSALAHYSWAASDHRVIFEALLRLANISPAALPHQLPAEATRMGFPDVAWDKFFAPVCPTDGLPDGDGDGSSAATRKCESSRTTTELIAALTTLAARSK